MIKIRIVMACIAAVLSVCAFATPSDEGMARYIVALTESASAEPDIAAMGGRVFGARMHKRLVEIPVAAAAELSKHPGVAYMQRLWDSSAPALQVSSQAVTTRVTTYSDTPDWTTGAYSYDSSGNIKSLGVDTFAYDSVRRILTSRVNDVTTTYQYDQFGNPSAHPVNARNQLEGRSYDAAGNMRTDASGNPYHYDGLAMIAGVPSIEGGRRMIYTADDERIAVVTASGNADETLRIRVRNFRKQVLRELTTNSLGTEWARDYVYAAGRLVGGERQVPNGQIGTRHYHLDHLGSIRLISRGGDAARITEPKYEPFGGEVRSSRDEAKLGYTPIEPLKFTGHERDYTGAENVETGDILDYMHARYYDPRLGRFLSVDPGRDWNAANPQSWNRYAYVRNNPLINTDPTGEKCYLCRSNFEGIQDSLATMRSALIAKVSFSVLRGQSAKHKVNANVSLSGSLSEKKVKVTGSVTTKNGSAKYSANIYNGSKTEGRKWLTDGKLSTGGQAKGVSGEVDTSGTLKVGPEDAQGSVRHDPETEEVGYGLQIGGLGFVVGNQEMSITAGGVTLGVDPTKFGDGLADLFHALGATGSPIPGYDAMQVKEGALDFLDDMNP